MTELLDNLTAKVKETQEKIVELQKQASEEGKRLFNEGAQVLFEEYPFVAQVTWTQYTPYFNDGDECTFSSSASYAGLATAKDVEDETWSAYEEHGEDFGPRVDEFDVTYPTITRPRQRWGANGYTDDPSGATETVRDYNNPITTKNPRWEPDYSEAVEAWHNFLGAFPDDIYKSVFGDHAIVKLTKAGAEVDDYEHE